MAGRVLQKRNYYHKTEFVSALTIGAVNTVLSGLLKVWLFSVALYIYNVVPWAIPRSWWGFAVCFVAVDFCRYWAHRIAHEQRFWWATHVTHHSSERMNFSVSFRTSWTQHIKFIFFLPVPLLGIDPFTFFICHQVAVLYQFFVHTELVRKLPAPIEYIFVTPRITARTTAPTQSTLIKTTAPRSSSGTGCLEPLCPKKKSRFMALPNQLPHLTPCTSFFMNGSIFSGT